jgi:hypothetical protein
VSHGVVNSTNFGFSFKKVSLYNDVKSMWAELRTTVPEDLSSVTKHSVSAHISADMFLL